MSHFQRRNDQLINPYTELTTQSETSFSTLNQYTEPDTLSNTLPITLPDPEAPKPNFLPLDNPQIVCLNSIAQSRYNLGNDHVIICNNPLLAQNLACDIAKSQLYDDPHMMHQRLIQMHNAHQNLKVDLEKIIHDLDQLPSFHTPQQRKLRTWLRKSRPMFLGTFAGLLLTVTTTIMIYMVVKMKVILHIFG